MPERHRREDRCSLKCAPRGGAVLRGGAGLRLRCADLLLPDAIFLLPRQALHSSHVMRFMQTSLCAASIARPRHVCKVDPRQWTQPGMAQPKRCLVLLWSSR